MEVSVRVCTALVYNLVADHILVEFDYKNKVRLFLP